MINATIMVNGSRLMVHDCLAVHGEWLIFNGI